MEHERKERARTGLQAARLETVQARQTQQAQETEMAAHVQTAWEEMHDAARTALRQEALSRLPAVNRQRYRACVEGCRPLPQLLQDVLDGLCDDLLRERLGLPRREKGVLAAAARFAPPTELSIGSNGSR